MLWSWKIELDGQNIDYDSNKKQNANRQTVNKFGIACIYLVFPDLSPYFKHITFKAIVVEFLVWLIYT